MNGLVRLPKKALEYTHNVNPIDDMTHVFLKCVIEKKL